MKLAVYTKEILLGIAWQTKALSFAKEVIIFKLGVTPVQEKTPQRFKILHDSESFLSLGEMCQEPPAAC